MSYNDRKPFRGTVSGVGGMDGQRNDCDGYMEA
jgi:hypothetical protein